ncbi:hypothetical protein JCM10450v2_007280 [Rhodotorula kratochvilovae]
MPPAYSVGATPPLTRRDSPAHSRFRFHGHSHAQEGGPPSSPPPDSARRGFLRSPLGGRSTGSKGETGKIPWDSPALPNAGGDDALHRPVLAHATRSEGDAGLLRVRSRADHYADELSVQEAPVSPGKGGGAKSAPATGGGGGGGFRRLVHKGSKFSLRSTLGLAPSHSATAAAGSSTPSSPPTSPLSSRSSAFAFPLSSSSGGSSLRSGRDSRARSLDGLNTPFVGTRGYATYPREISNPQSSRAPGAGGFLTPLPIPAALGARERKGSDEEGQGSVRGKAARLLGEEIVPSGKAAKILGMERKKTLVKKPSSASLLTADLSDPGRRPSLAPSSAFTLASSASHATPAHGHIRQRSLSVPARYSPENLLAPLRHYLPPPHESDDDDLDGHLWQPLTPVTPPPTFSQAGEDSPIETSDYAGSSPTLTRRSHSPTPSRESADSFPQTARIASFASSTFCASGIPSFYPASSAAPPDWRNSTWSSRRASDDPDGPPRLPNPKRLSPESIRFSAIFAGGRASEVFSGGSSGEASPRESVRAGTPRSAGASSAASKRPSIGPRSYSAGSSSGAGTPRRLSTLPEGAQAGSSSSSSTRSSTSAPPLPAPPPSLPPLPPLPFPPASQPRQHPQRSNTLLSTASSHTRRSQRSHALDALEGRPRRVREESAESTASTVSAASVESIGEMERRALEMGGLAAPRAEVEEVDDEPAPDRSPETVTRDMRESRPFLDLAWSSDDEGPPVPPRRAPPVPQLPERGLPPLPPVARRPSIPAPAPPSQHPPPAPPMTTSSSTLSLASSSSSSGASSSTRRKHLPHPPTVQLPRRAPPPAAPLPPVPPLPPSLRAPAPPLKPKPTHARHASRTSVQSVLSLSSSDEDDDEDDGDAHRLSAFPTPPLARPAAAAVGAGAAAVEGYRFPAAVAL